jgi:hypothetical protein
MAATIIKAAYVKRETMEKEMVGMRKETQTKLESIEKEMAEMRKEMTELRNTLTRNANDSPWNHALMRIREPPPDRLHKKHHRKITPEKNVALKQNLHKVTIKLTITGTDEATRLRLKETPGKEMTKTLQEAIDKEYKDKTDEYPRVCGFEVLSD